MNKFYGCRISDYLPYGGFQWLKSVDNFDVNSVCENNLIGYIFEVELEYPDELHAFHNGYPLAPEKLGIPYDILSDYCKKITHVYGIKVDDVKKLLPNFNDKTNSVLHYRSCICL